MDETPLSSSDARQFGLTEETANALSRRALEMTGFVLGADGRHGSGVFVEVPDGSTALLTATHVLIPTILSGDVTVVASDSNGRWRPRPIRALRIASRADAALIYLDRDVGVPRLAVSDWDPAAAVSVERGMGVIAVGAPGQWKSSPDVESRTIASMTTLAYWTAVTDPSVDGLIQCDVDQSILGSPSSLRGISGGPVLDTTTRLVGINKGEHRDRKGSIGSLFVTPRSSWHDLYYPFTPAPDTPTDYVRQRAVHTFHAGHEDSPPDSLPILVQIAAEYLWSPSAREHRFGEIGRVQAMTFGSTPSQLRYVMNLESLFVLPMDHDDKTRRLALLEEARFLLAAMRYRLIDGG